QRYTYEPGGTTNNKSSDTAIKVTRSVYAELEAEWDEGVVAKVYGKSKFDVSIEGHLNITNGQGEPITTPNGGDTGTQFTCSIAVAGANVTEVGAEAGVGFDIVVASAKATAGGAVEFNAWTEFRTESRPIPGA